MPRSTGSRRANANSTSTAQEGTVTTATDSTTETETDATPNFSFEVEAAPADFEPTRRSPGRQRRDSPFDSVLKSPKVYEKGWQRVPFESEEHKAAIVSELNRAKQHLGVGLDLDLTDEEYVFFKSRELQKRDRKTNGDSLPEQEGDEGDKDE